MYNVERFHAAENKYKVCTIQPKVSSYAATQCQDSLKNQIYPFTFKYSHIELITFQIKQLYQLWTLDTKL